MKYQQARHALTFCVFVLFVIPCGRYALISRVLIILLLVLCGIKCSRTPPAARGWQRPGWSPMGEALLLVLLTVGAGAAVSSWLPDRPLPARTGAGLWALTVLSAVSEELFFRSWLLGEYADREVPFLPMLLYSSAAFGVLHLWGGPAAAGFAFFTGLIYGMAFRRWGSLWPLLVSHILHNSFVLLWNYR